MIKRLAGTGLSKILTPRNVTFLLRSAARISTATGYYEFDIFDKIPEKPSILAFNHSFKAFGYVADQYILGAASPLPVRGIFYHKWFENEFATPILEKWKAIPTNKLRKLNGTLRDNEIIAIAPEGLEHMPNRKGELGAVWLAKTYQLPIIPTIITHLPEKKYVGLETREEIRIPKNATKQDLRDETTKLMEILEN